jgi:hypothetical protein
MSNYKSTRYRKTASGFKFNFRIFRCCELLFSVLSLQDPIEILTLRQANFLFRCGLPDNDNARLYPRPCWPVLDCLGYFNDK